MTVDNFFLFKLANSGFTSILGMFIIPLISIIYTCTSIGRNTALAIIVFLIGDVVIPISTIIGINLKAKFRIALRIILTVIASAVVIFNEFLCVVYYSNSKSKYNYSGYTSNLNDTNDYSNIEEIAGITLKVPDYFDVRKENYSGFEVAYYPETELAQATLGLKSLLDGVTSEQVRNSKDSIVSNWKSSFGETLKVSDYDIDGHYVLAASNEGSNALTKCAAIVNDKDEKVMVAVLTVDSGDATGYDYANDFDNMIKNVYIPQKAPEVNETIKPNISNQNNSKTPEKVQEITKPSNYKNSEVGDVINDYNNEIDKAKSELNIEIDKATDQLKDEMGLAGDLFGGYVDDYADAYKDAINDFSDIYKDTANEYGKIYDDLLDQFGY